MSKQEAPEVIKDFRKTIKALVELCPAYNSFMRAVKDAKGKRISEIGETYPEIMKGRIFPALTELGIQVGAHIDIDSRSIASYLLSLVEEVERRFDSEEIRNVIGSATGEVPPNPVRDYVKECTKSLRKKNKATLKVLRVAASERYGISFDELAKGVREKFGIELERNEIVESARRLNNLGLLSELRDNSLTVKKEFKKHILDIVKV